MLGALLLACLPAGKMFSQACALPSPERPSVTSHAGHSASSNTRLLPNGQEKNLISYSDETCGSASGEQNAVSNISISTESRSIICMLIANDLVFITYLHAAAAAVWTPPGHSCVAPLGKAVAATEPDAS